MWHKCMACKVLLSLLFPSSDSGAIGVDLSVEAEKRNARKIGLKEIPNCLGDKIYFHAIIVKIHSKQMLRG